MGTRYLALGLFGLVVAACGAKARVEAPAPEPLASASHSLRIDTPIVIPQSYRVTLALDPKRSDFGGVLESELVIRERAADFYLNGYGLTIHSAVLHAGGKSFDLSVQADGEHWLHFQAAEPFPKGPGQLQIRYSGQVSDKESFGIFRQEVEGDWYMFTQFEARGARRAFPCVDQPNLKVPFTIRLEVPEGLEVLSNAPEQSRATLTGSRIAVEFAPTKPLPSYLVAFALGPFDMVDVGMTRSQVPVRIAAPRGRGSETSWAKESTLPLLEILEDYLGTAYPFAKLDLVSIPATGAFGAMENPGLITYTETLLLSTSNSLEAKQSYASTGSHELAHQWFGNLVTSSWWDEIWLNESFATWAAAKTLASFRPEWRTESGWLHRRETAMNADRLASARVIRQPIVSEDDIGAAFDRITYSKGAAVLRMFEAWLGEEVFQRGIQHYLQSKAWNVASAADFLTAMDTGSGTKISAAFSSFLNTPGTPLVRFELECQADSAPSLQLSQERYLPLGSQADAAQVYQVPVCVRYPGAEGPVRQCTLLSAASQRLVLDQAAGCPTWLIPNDGGTGYYRSQVGEEVWADLIASPSLSSMERLILAQDLKAMVWAGRAPLASLLVAVETLAASKDDFVVQIAAELADLGRLVKAEERARYQKWLGKHFGRRARELGWTGKAGERPDRKELRNTLLTLMIFEGEDKRLRAAGVGIAERWFRDPSRVDPDLAGLALQVMAWRGEAALFDRFIEAIKGSSDRGQRRLLFHALGSASKPALVSKALAMMLDPEIDPRESQRTFIGLAYQRESSTMSFDFLAANVDALIAQYGAIMAGRLARVVSAQCEAEQNEAVVALLRDKISPLEGGANAAKQALESYQLCVASRQALRLPAL